MKSLVRRSAFFALVGLIPSPLAVVHAATPPADSVLFCAPFDYEQWRRDNPQPAGKRLALNVGEPRTVRMIYFLPNDLPFNQEEVNLLKTVIRRIQTFYAEQMQTHGFGNRTFRIETDAQGEPLVHRVDGRYSLRQYGEKMRAGEGVGVLYGEIQQTFDFSANIYLIAPVAAQSTRSGPKTSVGPHQGSSSAFALSVFHRARRS